MNKDVIKAKVEEMMPWLNDVRVELDDYEVYITFSEDGDILKDWPTPYDDETFGDTAWHQFTKWLELHTLAEDNLQICDIEGDSPDVFIFLEPKS